eukprot:6477888-Amphidinium_carterae.2
MLLTISGALWKLVCGLLELGVLGEGKSRGLFQGDLATPRADAFVSMYPRTLDILELLGNETYGVYSLREMSREEVLVARMLGTSPAQ